jgi:hypothetical protein
VPLTARAPPPQPATLQGFAKLTTTCGRLPIMPMLDAITAAVDGCNCTAPPALASTRLHACQPPSQDTPLAKQWLALPEAEACPLVTFAARLTTVNAACCPGLAGAAGAGCIRSNCSLACVAMSRTVI